MAELGLNWDLLFWAPSQKQLASPQLWEARSPAVVGIQSPVPQEPRVGGRCVLERECAPQVAGVRDNATSGARAAPPPLPILGHAVTLH